MRNLILNAIHIFTRIVWKIRVNSYSTQLMCIPLKIFITKNFSFIVRLFYFLCIRNVLRFKASAHSFERFTSRPFFKLSFSLSMHLLHRMNAMLDFIGTLQSSCEEHGTSDHYKKYCTQ